MNSEILRFNTFNLILFFVLLKVSVNKFYDRIEKHIFKFVFKSIMDYLIRKIKKLFKKNEFKEKIKKIKKDLNIRKKGLNYVFDFENKEIILRKSFGEDKYFEMIFNTNKKTEKRKYCFLIDYGNIICEIPELKETMNYLIKRNYFDKNSFILFENNKVFVICQLRF